MVIFRLEDDISGLGEKLHREVLKGCERSVRVAIESGQRNAQANAPTRSGELRRSIRASSVRVVSSGASGNLAIGVKYAEHVVGGTKPHVIVPRRRKALHWTAGGRDVFRKRVQHPGTRPNPFFLNACRVVSRVLEQAVDRGVDEAIRSL